MSKFEDHLWREVSREHGAGMAQVIRPPGRNSHRSRLIAGTSLGLAGAGTAVALVLSATTASPAFAVTRNHDGTVTVSITGYGGIAGANARLRQLRIRAEVMARVPSSCAPSMHGSPAPSPGTASARWIINPHKIPARRTLVLALPVGSNGNRGSGGQARYCRTGKPSMHGAPSPGAS